MHKPTPNGAALIGPWIKVPSPMSVEVMFSAGADFVCIDMCNGWLGIDQVNDLLAHQAGPRLVRLSSDASPAMVGQLLDAGADGIVIPHADSLAMAKKMVAAALFAPAGTRGMGSTGRAGRWGLAPLSTYLAGGEFEGGTPWITLMIESLEALMNIDELARIPGVSQLLVGSADLGAALGRDVGLMERATDDVLRACGEHGLSAAIATGSAADSASYIGRGFDTVFVSNDLTLLARSAQHCFQSARFSRESSSP